MNNPTSDKGERVKNFAIRYSKELIVALILAVLVGVGVEVWKARAARKAIEKNLKAVATLLTYDKRGTVTGQGSGFFINSTGMLVTNAHVIRGSANARAKLASGAFYELQYIKNIDSDVDVALLQFAANETPAVSDLGNSDAVNIGEKVFTIGTPVGQESTVSEGNISNPARELSGRKFLQFTAPISPGSSGGGLFNESGEIIGITTASLNTKGGPQAGLEQNINFAVPINDFKKTMGGTSRPNDAVRYFLQGTLADNQKDWDSAIRFYSRAIELDSLYSDAYLQLAGVYFEKREYELEVQNYLAATKTDTINSTTFYYLATAYEDVGEYGKAWDAFSKAYACDPENKEMLHDFSLLCLATGRKNEASVIIQQLSSLDPGWARILRSILRNSR